MRYNGRAKAGPKRYKLGIVVASQSKYNYTQTSNIVAIQSVIHDSSCSNQ